MSEQAHAPTGAPTNTAAARVIAPPIPSTAATPTVAEQGAVAHESDAKVAAAESALAAEKVRSTIATKLLATDTRLAGESAFGIVEHLVQQKVAAGVDVADAVVAVMTEYPYLRAAAAALPVVESAGATTGASPAAAGTTSPATGGPPPVVDALTMTRAEWAAHRSRMGM